MKTVKQIVEDKPHRLLCISPDKTVYEALRVMAEHEIGALVVIDEKKLVGMFSERDYARKVILQGRASKQIFVSEIMTSRVVCVTPDRTAEECMSIMTEKKVRHLPVVEEKTVMAMISIGDVVREMIADQQQTIAQLEHYITG